jgi:hypothetical protein
VLETDSRTLNALVADCRRPCPPRQVAIVIDEPTMIRPPDRIAVRWDVLLAAWCGLDWVRGSVVSSPDTRPPTNRARSAASSAILVCHSHIGLMVCCLQQDDGSAELLKKPRLAFLQPRGPPGLANVWMGGWIGRPGGGAI